MYALPAVGAQIIGLLCAGIVITQFVLVLGLFIVRSLDLFDGYGQ